MDWFYDVNFHFQESLFSFTCQKFSNFVDFCPLAKGSYPKDVQPTPGGLVGFWIKSNANLKNLYEGCKEFPLFSLFFRILYNFIT